MPSYDDYWSDASFSEESSEEDEEPEELYDPRDQDYWAIESFLDSRTPPPIIEYVSNIGTFSIREAIVNSIRTDIDSVVPLASTHSWQNFWSGGPRYTRAYFKYDDWDAIGEFCFNLCLCCDIKVDMTRVRSCIIYLLSYGNFKSIVR